MTKSREDKGTALEVRVELKEPKDEQTWSALAAYLFTGSGRFLARGTLHPDPKVKGSGIAKFDVRGRDDTLLVKIGPAVSELRDLRRHQLAVKRVLVTPRSKLSVNFEIAKPAWWCWLKIPYSVTGTVNKRVDDQERPICVGEVDIYDVDTYFFLRLPDPVVERIREGLIDLVVDPAPVDLQQLPNQLYLWDDNDDQLSSVPEPMTPVAGAIRDRLSALPHEWSFAVRRFDTLASARSRIDSTIAELASAQRQAYLSSDAVPGVKISQILYTNTDQLRHLLVDEFQALRFWLCWYPWIYWLWWPWCRSYSLEKLGTAELQSDGSFSKMVPLSVCRNDTPDLWFVVRQAIDSHERVIYRRYPVLCHTFWNHPSRKPVHLLVTDPDAVTCGTGPQPDKPDVYVMPLGIGNDGWYDIRQAHIKGTVLLDPDQGLYHGKAPYGSRLDLQMQFHDDLAGHYYRWSYAPAGSTSWKSIDTPLFHRYLTKKDGRYYLIPEKVGPFTVGTEDMLFAVPDPAKDWVVITREDRASALWQTSAIANGRHTLRLEMFDAGGNKLIPSSAGFKYFLPIAKESGGIVLVDDNPNVHSDGSIYLNVRIDNTDTKAEIKTVGLGSIPTAECQFIEYTKDTDKVRVRYDAYHTLPPKRDFLESYELKIKRGISGTKVYEFHSSTPAFQGDDVNQEVGVKQLLNGYPRCTFAVELHTYALTRDGFNQIRAYEAHDTAAFALEPES